MKIEILSWSSYQGGAARAANRLFSALKKYQKSSINVNMRVNNTDFDMQDIISPETKFGIGWNLIRRYAGLKFQSLQKTSNLCLHSSGLLPCSLDKKINNSKADLINLHWIQGEMLSIKSISRINKPLIFTLHDSWAFSGSEHYPNGYNDRRYIEGYLKKNLPISHKGLDIDRLSWNMKIKYWKKKYQIVSPSNWLAECARQSKLMREWPIDVIPNPVPLNTFKPFSKKLAKKVFNLDPKKKYILFCALKGSEDLRKGWDLLLPALKRLSELRKNLEVIVLGENEPLNIPKIGMKINYLGQFNDDQTLALVYSTADLVVVPSRMENLPQTATEAQSCGTPVLAFNCSGFPDVISHKETGYLAEPFNVKSLLNGMLWILKNVEENKNLSKKSRSRACLLWNPSEISYKYKTLYEKVIQNCN